MAASKTVCDSRYRNSGALAGVLFFFLLLLSPLPQYAEALAKREKYIKYEEKRKGNGQPFSMKTFTALRM